jgi:sulfotransferase
MFQDKNIMEQAFLGFCRAGMQGFFNNITEKQFIVDKSRDWGIHYNLLNMLNESPKIICMVRDVRSIYSSMEKNFRKNPHRESHIQNAPQLVGTTLDKRVNIWADGMPVGIAMDRLKDCIQQGIDKKMLFIRYEDLMENPENEIKRLYEYLELPYYESHDFENITQFTQENDLIHGIYGDHTLRPKFERKPDDYEEILGFELSNNIKLEKSSLRKMMFIMNALDQGWSIKKRNNAYVFTKNHEGKKEVLEDSYLLKFMKTNLDLNKVFS